MLPLAERFKSSDGTLPYFIQFYLMYAVSARFLANMNNRNKRNMSEEELELFFKACKKVLDLLDDTIILNAGKYKALGYSEEAAEMFYMLKYGQTLYTMPQHLSEGNEDVALDVNDVVVARMQGQRVGLHVLDYTDGKLLLDGSFRQVFNLKNIELYAEWNGERIDLEDNDRYSLTKYFGISAYKKFTFHLELPIDDQSVKAEAELLREIQEHTRAAAVLLPASLGEVRRLSRGRLLALQQIHGDHQQQP